MLHLHPDGSPQIIVIGPDLEAGQRPPAARDLILALTR
jgi:hypothetical protein